MTDTGGIATRFATEKAPARKVRHGSTAFPGPCIMEEVITDLSYQAVPGHSLSIEWAVFVTLR